jgi:uncharacterized protein (DUF1499 family)
MRVFIHTSTWAVWAARFARPVVPLVLLAVLLHFIEYLSSEVFVASIVVAILLSLLSMTCALIGYVRMWYNGDAGWRTAAFGLVLGLASIGFLAVFAYLDNAHPRTTDVTTASFEIPLAPNRDGQATSATLANDAQYQGAISRQYQTSIQTFLEALDRTAAQFGLKPNGERAISPSETIKFYVAKTWLGFKDDVSIYFRETENLVIVEMRSSSRFGESDLGTNAKRIAEVLAAIDERVAAARGIEITEES